jgi:hypothetical protein
MTEETAKNDLPQAEAPAAKAPKAAKEAKPKVARVRSLVGRFLILHSNIVIGEGEEKKVEIDPWIQLQIDAGKLEIVVD